MRDIVFLEGLEARGIIGVEEWERTKAQTIRIDLEMACDAAAAARDEDLTLSVNYRAVAKAILAHIDENAYLLVETLAERLAEMIRRDFGVSWLRLTVSKPGAVRFSENVGVVIERGSRDAQS